MESLQSFWSRRTYQRLNKNKKRVIIRLGGERKRYSWRVGAIQNVFTKVPVRILSPKKLLKKMRDAYVNSMLVLAGGVPLAKKSSTKVEAVWGKRIPKAREVGTRGKEFEMRMMVHIYNTLVYSTTPRELISCQ